MSADPRLVRAYRRLTRFYPPGPRRAELLDTLIECAPPGRRRPAAAEVANLVRHGSRARLGRPRSTGVVVLAVFVALAAGFAGASAASRVGLEAVGSLPVGAEAAEINRTVFPGLTVWGGGDAAKIVTQGDGDGVEYGYAISWVRSTPATRWSTRRAPASRPAPSPAPESGRAGPGNKPTPGTTNPRNNQPQERQPPGRGGARPCRTTRHGGTGREWAAGRPFPTGPVPIPYVRWF